MVVIELNRQAMEQAVSGVRLEITPAASRLFKEPGTLEQIALLARGWFRPICGS